MQLAVEVAADAFGREVCRSRRRRRSGSPGSARPRRPRGASARASARGASGRADRALSMALAGDRLLLEHVARAAFGVE